MAIYTTINDPDDTEFEISYYVDEIFKGTQKVSKTSENPYTINNLDMGYHSIKVTTFDKLGNEGSGTTTGRTKMHTWKPYTYEDVITGYYLQGTDMGQIVNNWKPSGDGYLEISLQEPVIERN